MKKHYLGLAMASMLLISTHLSAEALGYINVSKVFSSYQKAIKMTEQFEEKQRSLKKDIDEREAELSKAVRDGKTQTEIDNMKEKFRKELEPRQKELQEFNQQSTGKIREDIIKATDAVAKEVGLSMVLDQQVFITGGIDMTDLVIKKLNKK